MYKMNLSSRLIGQLHQACEGAALRGSRVISAEDILFLMRKDKVKKQEKNINVMFNGWIKCLFLWVSPSDESGEAVKVSPVQRL